MADKRRSEENGGALIKRARADEDGTVIPGVSEQKIARTSDLMAPIMQLTGHQGEIFSCKFSPDGQHIASGSFDRDIFLWDTYGECKNYNVLKGHAGAVLEVAWSKDGSHIYSASSDKTASIWDATVGERLRRFKGHTNIINSMSICKRGLELIATGSDDSTIKIWDSRTKESVESFTDKYQVTAVAWSDDGSLVYSGGLDNHIKAWDLRKKDVVYTLKGHFDTITGLRLSPDGNYLLSNAMDNTVRIWDVKPFAVEASRMLKVFEGSPHGFEKNLLKPCWSPDGDYVAAGGGDRTVTVWEVATRKILYKLPGHKGCVNEVAWHRTQPIILSASSDKTMFLGEIAPS
ncbi:hypothetical protein SmJEL517_g05496 [Synchytrium microbalum]|uniref:Uncharacterized protein n=1 Tax=Synchytrium microbalum TaxID=1806994 RepID=A0A507C0F7_9FUNG|nr:uncharacterized protein SmJEL517_g05496 [Synchytrium microbalum]TPX31065.1 hypothetical protein SmJEL517_g05496 [Synchytrium microbalum]